MGATNNICYVMGVSGSGKTTLGRKLARELEVPFFDGDDFHPPENIRKMAGGAPLEDADRIGWLHRINELARSHQDSGAVIACSALKEAYRKILENGLQGKVQWIYLQGTYNEILERVSKREGHFMPAALLKSQFDTLEPPGYGIVIPVALSPAGALEKALKKLQSPNR